MKYTQYHRNNKLKTIRHDWNGNINYKGKYQNLNPAKSSGIGNLFKLKFKRNPDRHIKRAENWDPYCSIVTDVSHIKEDTLIWLGHNSFFIQLDDKKIILDPVFGHIPFIRRKSNCAAKPSALKGIDYMLISHDHYDHLDKKSVKAIVHYNPDVTIICGLEIEKLIRRWVGNSINIIEAGWYQQFTDDILKITFLPCQHWGKRSFKDDRERLWGAFMIESKRLKVYYSGDTSYGSHFKEVHHLFGAPDYAIIGIGTYKPRWFMQANHISPYDAVKAAKDMGAKTTIPMHYGAFDLSNEPLSDPPEVFSTEAKHNNIDVYIPYLGEFFQL